MGALYHPEEIVKAPTDSAARFSVPGMSTRGGESPRYRLAMLVSVKVL